MNIQHLVADLTALATESKRRSSEVRNAADSAISLLKKYSAAGNISSIDLGERTDVAKPFCFAIASGNVKITTLAIPVVHRLIMAKLIPSQMLQQLLDGLREASNLAVDIQLRILQCLPSLLQNYAPSLHVDLLLKLLGICAVLSANNKSTVVINTASATLQQLFSNVFDQIPENDPGSNMVATDADTSVDVGDLSYEGFRIFKDLCLVVQFEKPEYFDELSLVKPLSVLEIVESIVGSHKLVFQNHVELSFLLRTKLVPALLRILNSSNSSFSIPGTQDSNVTSASSFPLITRTMRVLLVLLATQLEGLEIEAEIVLSFLNHLLINNESHQWEKILVLELFKSLFSDFTIIKLIFENYDNNPKKKNVLGELLAIINTFMQHNSYLVQETVKPFAKSSVHLSRSGSSIKISILDHLDKSEPPSVIPQTYPIYLIYSILLSFAEGIANFVQILSDNANAATLEADVEFTNYFIEAIYQDVSALFKVFIYSSMDNESFHLLIRSLQRFTHATGLLGLADLRDGLLEILSRAIITNTSDSTPATSSNPNSFQEQGKQLLAFGESLVESLSSTLQGSESQSNVAYLHSRNFNNRHVTCLRALTNLAVSLGSTLQSSWKIVWITFQWCDYFIYGPDLYSGFNSKQTFPEDMLPDLTSQDLTNIETSRRKLYESIAEFPEESFHGLLKSLIELSDVLVAEKSEKEFSEKGSAEKELSEKESNEREPPKSRTSSHHSHNDPSDLCPYNKAFYLTNISIVCQVNSNKFLIETDYSWNLICEYFVKLSTTRTVNSQLRIHTINTFNKIIKFIAAEGFGSTDKNINIETSKKSLSSINRFLSGLFELGKPQELQVLNCETELHLLSLTTLHELIDKFDTHYQESWDIVFQILSTPFKVKDFSKDSNLREKVRLLIDSSFDTLKLILDEFMSTLPFNHLKLLIDTLSNFCLQTYDLNISFSSISYFWLISDSLKSRMSKLTVVKLPQIENPTNLITYVEKESAESYISLDIYLLYTLMGLTADSRPQVRDGAIQTFFQIIEVHGYLISKYGAWDCIYQIVLSQVFDVSELSNNIVRNKTEWIQSLTLILQGLVSIYNKFVMDFTVPTFEKWAELDKFLNNLLGFGVLELNLKVFKSFHELLQPFKEQSSEGAEIAKVRDLLLQFWVGVSIDYDLVNPQLYQECITCLMDCFPQLYPLVRTDFTIAECQTVLNSLNKCARYPVLPSTILDTNKPSKLQASIVKNFEVIDVTDAGIQSIIIQQLSNIIVYPFGLRDRISLKLANNAILDKVKIPTFVAMSHLCVKLLKEKLLALGDWSVLVSDKGVNKMLKSLLQVIDNKFKGIDDAPVWIEANEIFKSIVKKMSSSSGELDDELWVLIMSGVASCFDGADASNEEVNMKQYQDLISLVLPKLLEKEHDVLISDFLTSLYRNSYLYEFNEIEELLNEEEGINGLIDGYTNYEFSKYFGTTIPVVKKPNVRTKINCLEELIKFAKEPVNEQLNDRAQQLLICRAAFTLRRFINDSRLLGRCPISKIQEKELLIILGGLISLERVSEEQRSNLRKLQRLLVKLVPFAGRCKGLDVWLQDALTESFTK